MLHGVKAKVNLIPFNEHQGSEFKCPDEETIQAFQTYLLNRQIVAKRKPSWLDLFAQEQKGTEHLIDVGKLQMFTWMVAALIIYGAMLVAKLTLPLEEVVELTDLPNVTGTILTLMGISQAAYLGMKLPNQASSG